MSETETDRLPREQRGRQEYLDGLEEYITECQTDITDMLDKLGWTPEHFMKARNLCVCAHNEGHHMPRASLEKHEEVCKLVTQGCTKEEAEMILADTNYQYEGATCVYTVKLDKIILNSVLWNHHMQNQSVFYGIEKMPLTPNEEEQMLSREDRLGMAEYIIKRAKEANRLKELGRDELLVSENLADMIRKDTEERKLDPVEEMAALRDYRRRRQTYRAKNVHITKKSHTEIMREVIANQMEMYAKSLTGEEGSIGEDGSLAGVRTRDPWKQEEPDENRKDKDKNPRSHDRDHYSDRERTRDRETWRESVRENRRDGESRRDRDSGRDDKSDRDRHSRNDRYEEEGYSRQSEKSRASSKHESDRYRSRDRRRSDSREVQRRDSDRSRSRVRDDASNRERKSEDFENQSKACEKSAEKPGVSGHGTTEGDNVGEIDVKKEDHGRADNVDQTVSDLEEGEVSGRGDVETQGRSHSRSRSKHREKEKKRKKHKHRRSRSRSASSDRSSRKKHKKQKHKHRKREERDSETGAT